MDMRQVYFLSAVTGKRRQSFPYKPSVFQDIPYKIVVFVKTGEIVMATAVNTDQGDLAGIDLLQGFTVTDRDQPVAGTMDDIGMAVYAGDPFVGSQVITEHHPYGQDRQKTFHHSPETVIGGVQDQVTGLVIAGQFGGETTSHAPAIHDEMVLRVLIPEAVIYKLHIPQHFLFAPLAGTLSETPVIHEHHIIVITVKIPCVTGPALDAAGIAVKIQDQAFGILPVKMKGIDADPGFDIKKILPEGGVIPELEILPEFLRLENEFFLQKIGQDGKSGDADDDIPEKMNGSGFWLRSES